MKATDRMTIQELRKGIFALQRVRETSDVMTRLTDALVEGNFGAARDAAAAAVGLMAEVHAELHRIAK